MSQRAVLALQGKGHWELLTENVALDYYVWAFQAATGSLSLGRLSPVTRREAFQFFEPVLYQNQFGDWLGLPSTLLHHQEALAVE